MRATIDRSGRVVIPKALRDQAGFAPGSELEVNFRDGRIEIEPATVPMQLVRHGELMVVDPGEVLMPVLTSTEVREILERARR